MIIEKNGYIHQTHRHTYNWKYVPIAYKRVLTFHTAIYTCGIIEHIVALYMVDNKKSCPAYRGPDFNRALRVFNIWNKEGKYASKKEENRAI